MIKRVMLNWN